MMTRPAPGDPLAALTPATPSRSEPNASTSPPDPPPAVRLAAVPEEIPTGGRGSGSLLGEASCVAAAVSTFRCIATAGAESGPAAAGSADPLAAARSAVPEACASEFAPAGAARRSRSAGGAEVVAGARSARLRPRAGAVSNARADCASEGVAIKSGRRPASGAALAEGALNGSSTAIGAGKCSMRSGNDTSPATGWPPISGRPPGVRTTPGGSSPVSEMGGESSTPAADVLTSEIGGESSTPAAAVLFGELSGETSTPAAALLFGELSRETSTPAAASLRRAIAEIGAAG